MNSTFLQSRTAKTKRWPTCPLPVISPAISPGQNFQANTWVTLLELPHPYSYDQALLLTAASDQTWVVWIPDYGQAMLSTAQFA
jgi:hypothetical protein